MAFWTSILSSGLGNKNYTVYTLSIYYLVIGFTNIFVSFQGQQAAHEIWDGSLSAELMSDLFQKEKKTLGVFKEILGEGFNAGDTDAIRNIMYTKHPAYAANPDYSYERLWEILK